MAAMMFAEWSGKMVRVNRMDTRGEHRKIFARDTVVGVQCSGDTDNGFISITMANGKTDVYHASGMIYRRG